MSSWEPLPWCVVCAVGCVDQCGKWHFASPVDKTENKRKKTFRTTTLTTWEHLVRRQARFKCLEVEVHHALQCRMQWSPLSYARCTGSGIESLPVFSSTTTSHHLPPSQATSARDSVRLWMRFYEFQKLNLWAKNYTRDCDTHYV